MSEEKRYRTTYQSSTQTDDIRPNVIVQDSTATATDASTWGYDPHHYPKLEDGEERCLARECADELRKSRNLPAGTPVPVFISCPCPRCTPRIS